MLSIQFGPEKEWWVSGKVFERLFQSALDAKEIPEALADWRHVADATGGLDLSDMEPTDAKQLTSGLRRAAEREVGSIGEKIDPTSELYSYRVSLLKLLRLGEDVVH
jgi:hypothetical protein